MKILQIIPSFGMGGAEKVVLNYMRAAKNAHLDMVTISLYQPGGSVYDEVIKEEQLQVIYLNKKLGMDLRLIPELRRKIREINPDVVHTHLYVLKYYLLTGEFRKRKNFHTVHSLPRADASGMDYWLNRFLFQRGRAVPIALHQGLVKEINEYYHTDSTVVVENGIFADEFKSAKRSARLQEEFGIKDDDFVIGHVGKLKEVKNHIFLLDLLKEVLETESRAKLLLVGDGELAGKLKSEAKARHIESKVVFCGDRTDIPAMLKLMDVFVFPSLYEGLGLAVIEAQMAGIRCIASDAVPKETAVSNGIQYLSLQEEKSVWVKSILDKSREGVKLTQAAERFSIGYTMEKLMELYNK